MKTLVGTLRFPIPPVEPDEPAWTTEELREDVEVILLALGGVSGGVRDVDLGRDFEIRESYGIVHFAVADDYAQIMPHIQDVVLEARALGGSLDFKYGDWAPSVNRPNWIGTSWLARTRRAIRVSLLRLNVSLLRLKR
jgi:hypothetical protein